MNWRNSREYRLWRIRVIRRDKRCVVCKTLKNRQAHHIYHATYYPEFRFDENNGVCLCRECHTNFHTNFKKSFRQKCDLKDWHNFLALKDYFKIKCKEL